MNDSVKIKAIGRDIDDNDYDEDAAAAVDNISSFGSGVAFAVAFVVVVVVRDVFLSRRKIVFLPRKRNKLFLNEHQRISVS